MTTLGKQKLFLVLFVALIVVSVGVVFKYYFNSKVLAQRREMIHERGTLVMPFNLDETTHVFSSTDDGGFMQVKAKNPNDKKQISLIRAHLLEEADNFNSADFSDPRTLHGENMPGLSTLSSSGGKYTVEYNELVDGAQLTFNTSDPEISSALHMWFMAQMTDHGNDATGM